MTELVIFYDGFCPLCVREMGHLRRIDKDNKLQLVDIQQPDFEQRYPHINRAEASSILLSQCPDGRLLRGLDSTHRAWSVVGKGWRTAWLRWPIIRWFADRAYLYFARNRYRISELLTSQARCEPCSRGDGCSLDTAAQGRSQDQ